MLKIIQKITEREEDVIGSFFKVPKLGFSNIYFSEDSTITIIL